MNYDYSETVKYLLDWFEFNKRILPWRDEPSPYHVWISEIMLQQTRVEAVKGYYERFTRELPDVAALAGVDEERLLKLWEGLGYYNRAKNLKKAAGVIVEKYEGQVPADFDALLKLPGIGSYTAGAIASIAFGMREPAVDGNVLRVMKRLAGSFDDITKSSVKKELEKELRKILPEGRAGDYNQSIMDLGATICLPNGKPVCEKCPVMHLCRAFHEDTWSQIPVKPAKKARKIEERTVFLLECEGKLLLHKREQTGLLSGMWEFPNTLGIYGMEKAERFLTSSGFELLTPLINVGKAKHIFSHIEWHMTGFYVKGRLRKGEFPLANHELPLVAEPVIKYGGQWKMKEEALEFFNPERTDYRFAEVSEIRDTISLPSAFETYRRFLFAQEGETVPE